VKTKVSSPFSQVLLFFVLYSFLLWVRKIKAFVNRNISNFCHSWKFENKQYIKYAWPCNGIRYI